MSYKLLIISEMRRIYVTTTIFLCLLSSVVVSVTGQGNNANRVAPPDSAIMAQALKLLYGVNHEVDYVKAHQLLNYLANKEFADAFNALGQIYNQGLGVEVDLARSLMCYDKAHQLGSLSGTINLSTAYRRGDGAPRNYKLAFELADYAAQKMHPKGYYLAGNQIFKGLGTEQDYEKARIYFEKGAALGNKECIYMLGVIYMKGYGTEPDYEKSRKHFKSAMDRGHGWVEDIIRQGEFEKEDRNRDRRLYKLKSGNSSKLDTLIMFPNSAKGDELEGNWQGTIYNYDWAGRVLDDEREIKVSSELFGDELWLTWCENDKPLYRIMMQKGTQAWVVRHFTSLTGEPVPNYRFRQMRLSIDNNNDSKIIYGNLLQYSNRSGERMPPSAFALKLQDDTPGKEATVSVLRVFPNPFVDKFSVEIELAVTGEVAIEVYDMAGRRVYRQPFITFPEGMHTIPVMLKNMNEGGYVVHIIGPGVIKTETLIKK